MKKIAFVLLLMTLLLSCSSNAKKTDSKDTLLSDSSPLQKTDSKDTLSDSSPLKKIYSPATFYKDIDEIQKTYPNNREVITAMQSMKYGQMDDELTGKEHKPYVGKSYWEIITDIIKKREVEKEKMRKAFKKRGIDIDRLIDKTK